MRRRAAGRGVAATGALLTALVAATPAVARRTDDPLRATQWYLDATGADLAQRAGTGTGVTVAVLDTGVDAAHPDLAGAVVKGPDLIGGDDDPSDATGHGTAVAGIIAARAHNGIGIQGAAPGARVLAIRVIDAKGGGTTDTVARGIDAAVAGGAQVINLSLGVAPDAVAALLPDSTIVEAMDRAANAGVVIVAAAGNNAQPLCAQPLVQVRILCVGAVDRRRRLASYSNFGLRVDLVAPGGEIGGPDEAIVSTRMGGGYAAVAGTSDAAPQVSATAAILMGLGFTSAQAIDRIEATARDLGTPGVDFTYGHGMLDMAAAVRDLGFTPAMQHRQLHVPADGGSCRASRSVAEASLVARGIRIRCRLASTARRRVRIFTSRGLTLGSISSVVRRGVRTTLLVHVTAGRLCTTRWRRTRILLWRVSGSHEKSVNGRIKVRAGAHRCNAEPTRSGSASGSSDDSRRSSSTLGASRSR